MNSSKLLALVVCGAGPASQANKLVASAQKRGWTVQVRITNPARELATKEFVDAHAQTERGEPDAIIIAPASFNTINKLSGGISDERHLDFLHPRIKRVPTVILPFVNKGYADREVYKMSIERLRNEGVSIVEVEPHDVGKGDAEVDHFPWDAGLDEIDSLMGRRGNS
jgi:phosphopantothenoylcysteine synthetase/decarboxylase